jgi:hypothetical protein
MRPALKVRQTDRQKDRKRARERESERGGEREEFLLTIKK